MRDFFFRVAALTFESSVLAELERSSARKIGDTVREYPWPAPWGCPPLAPHPPTLCPSRDQQQRERPVPVGTPQETQVLPVRGQPRPPPVLITLDQRGATRSCPPAPLAPCLPRHPRLGQAGAPVRLP